MYTPGCAAFLSNTELGGGVAYVDVTAAMAPMRVTDIMLAACVLVETAPRLLRTVWGAEQTRTVLCRH